MDLFLPSIRTDVPAQALVHRWTGALRSGEYAQAKGYLRTPKGYCCLGVACNLLRPDGWLEEARLSESGFSFLSPHSWPSSVALPADVASLLHFKSPDGNYMLDGVSHTLTDDNDERNHTFAQIADTIERELSLVLAQ
jgi:hypothetical protein